MARETGDRRSIYVGRKTPSVRKLSLEDWEDIECRSQRRLPEDFKREVDQIIETFTKFGVGAVELVTAKYLKRRLNEWSMMTYELSASLSELPLKQRSPMPARKSKPGNRELKRVVNEYFSPRLFDSKNYSTTDISRVMNGAIKLSQHLISRIVSSKAPRADNVDFWVVWGALLLSACKKFHVPFAHKKKNGQYRRQFRADFIDLILLIQEHLPNIQWSRNEPLSIRKALKHAVPISGETRISPLKKVLHYWSSGRFDIFEAVPESEHRNVFALMSVFASIQSEKKKMNRAVKKNLLR